MESVFQKTKFGTQCGRRPVSKSVNGSPFHNFLAHFFTVLSVSDVIFSSLSTPRQAPTNHHFASICNLIE